MTAPPTRFWMPTPFVQGEMTAPKGLLLHSSRSGHAGNSEMLEYQATARYCVYNPDGLAWHASVGPGIIAVHMTPRQWGWNARAPASQQYIAVEFAQPTIGDAISDEQIEAYCWWVLNEVLPVWPNLPHVLVHHASLASGIADGKSDVYPNGDARQEQFSQRVRAGLGW